MKDIRNFLEVKDDTICTLPRWADFMRIGIGDEEIEFFKAAELHERQTHDSNSFGVNQSQIEKLKVGESYYDEKDGAVYVMLTDLSALNEK